MVSFTKQGKLYYLLMSMFNFCCKVEEIETYYLAFCQHSFANRKQKLAGLLTYAALAIFKRSYLKCRVGLKCFTAIFNLDA